MRQAFHWKPFIYFIPKSCLGERLGIYKVEKKNKIFEELGPLDKETFKELGFDLYMCSINQPIDYDDACWSYN